MADWREELERARDEARKAREEAERLRKEAREMERRLRHEGRDRAREERDRAREERRRDRELRRGPAGPPPGPLPPGKPWALGFNSFDEEGDGQRSEENFALEGVRFVHVEQTAGKVLIRPCAEGETPGVTTSGSKSPPKLEVRQLGERLEIEVRLSVGWLFRRKQGATTVVRLAHGLQQMRLNLGYGTAQVRDLQADHIKIDIGAGDVQAYSARGRVDINVGAGKISVYDHHGLASADTGTGDVLVDVAEVTEGDYRVNAGIGRVEVRIPPQLAVRLRVESGMGRARREYEPAPGEPHIRVEANTGVGEAIVKARQMGQAPQQPPVTPRPQRPARQAAQRRREAEELRVLQMLEQGKITSQEAADLIAALQGVHAPPEDEDLPDLEELEDADTEAADEPEAPANPEPFA